MRGVKPLPGVEDFLDASPNMIFESVVKESSRTMGGPVVVVLLDHLDLVNLYLTESYPPDPHGFSAQLPIEVEDGPLASVVREHSVVCEPAERWHIRPLEDRYLSCAPLRLRDTTIGALFFGGDEPQTEAELDSLRRLGIKAGVAISVADQYTDIVEVARRRDTPSIAAELQSDQLPPPSLFTPEVQVVGGIEPVYDVGGDWFDYDLGANGIFIAVCDGVGRGLPAASISYVTLGAVRNARKKGCDLKEIMEFAHQALISATTYEQFATLLLARIDLTTLQMELISAAHPAPIVVPPERSEKPGLIPLPHSHYPPLGAFSEGVGYECSYYQLQPGSRLLFFSDGATERRNAAGERLGVQRLMEYADESRKTAKMELLRFLMTMVESFGEDPVEDDVTIVGVDLPPFG